MSKYICRAAEMAQIFFQKNVLLYLIVCYMGTVYIYDTRVISNWKWQKL